jgi:hypothetical protein
LNLVAMTILIFHPLRIFSSWMIDDSWSMNNTSLCSCHFLLRKVWLISDWSSKLKGLWCWFEIRGSQKNIAKWKIINPNHDEWQSNDETTWWFSDLNYPYDCIILRQQNYQTGAKSISRSCQNVIARRIGSF